jgi:hypothetical protein
MAAKLFRYGGVDHNWSTTGNWSPSGQPIVSDTVTFDSTSQAVTVTSGATCASIDFTNYTNTITFSANLTVAGNVTLGASMTFAGASTLIVNTTATLISNGKVCSVPLNLVPTSTTTYTINGADWNNSANITVGSASYTTAIGGTNNLTTSSAATAAITGTITLSTNVVISGATLTSIASGPTINGASNTWSTNGLTETYIIAGTSTILLTGGTWSGGSGANPCNISVTISGNCTISGTLYFAYAGTPTLTYTNASYTITGASAPTISIGGSCTLNCTAASMNSALITANSPTISGTGATFTTYTNSTTLGLAGPLTFTGLLTLGAGAVNTSNSSYMYAQNGVTFSGITTGTSTIVISGGTLGCGSVNQACLNITIAGAVTLSSASNFGFGSSGTPTFTFSSGSLTTTSTTFEPYGPCTLNTSGISWNSVQIYSAATTITINSAFVMTGTLTLPSNGFTLTGSGSFSCTNMTLQGYTYTFNIPTAVTGVLTLPATASVVLNGTGTWTIGTLTATTSVSTGYTYTLHAGTTYSISTALNIAAQYATLPNVLTSDNTSTLAIVTLGYGATQSIGITNLTRIDASNGQTLYSYLGTITGCKNVTNSLSNGNIVSSFSGAATAISGYTYNKSGVALGSCQVYLFRDNGNNTATYVAQTTSNVSTGAYTFTVYPGSTYFVVAFGTYNTAAVFDVTARTIASS